MSTPQGAPLRRNPQSGGNKLRNGLIAYFVLVALLFLCVGSTALARAAGWLNQVRLPTVSWTPSAAAAVATEEPTAVQAPLAHLKTWGFESSQQTATAQTAAATAATASIITDTATFDSAWTVEQLKSWVLAGQGYEEQNGRFWQIINTAKENGQLHWTRSLSDPYDCVGIPEVMNKWGSHDSCGIWQSEEELNGTFTIELSKFDVLFKSRKWIDGTMTFWNTAAVRFGGSSDLVAYVRYGNEASQTCEREFEMPEGITEVVFVNVQPGGNHQITFGETSPKHQNECRPVSSTAK